MPPRPPSKTRRTCMRFLRLVFGKKSGEVATLLLVVVLAYLFPYRGARFFRVPSASMEPTLLPMDNLITLKERSYTRGDIVVLKDPEERGAFVVKRVVAAAGDTVAVSGGALYVNGEYVSEPYIKDPAMYAMRPASVGPGEVLLLGDNRNNSQDSHLWEPQCQTSKAIVGRVRFIYFPYPRFGTVKSHAPVSVPIKERGAA